MDLSEQGKLVNRTIFLTAKQLVVCDCEGTLLTVATRRELSEATVVKTGSGAYMEIKFLHGVARRIAFSPLSGMKELYCCSEQINNWVQEDSKAFTQTGTKAENVNDGSPAIENDTKPLTWRQSIQILLGLAHYALPYRKQIIMSDGVLLFTVGLAILPPI
jgi:hypothetical protein